MLQPAQTAYKQRHTGLYGGLALRTGANVSSKPHRVTTITPRVFRPNMFRKRVYSETLGRFVRLKIAARVIRTLDKVGGLDNYLLGKGMGRGGLESVSELGAEGWRLRWAILERKRSVGNDQARGTVQSAENVHGEGKGHVVSEVPIEEEGPKGKLFDGKEGDPKLHKPKVSQQAMREMEKEYAEDESTGWRKYVNKALKIFKI